MEYVVDLLRYQRYNYGRAGFEDIEDNFSYNFQDWIQPLPFGGAKLCSFRYTDQADVESRPWFGQKENNLVWKQRLKKTQLKEIFLLVNLL